MKRQEILTRKVEITKNELHGNPRTKKKRNIYFKYMTLD